MGLELSVELLLGERLREGAGWSGAKELIRLLRDSMDAPSICGVPRTAACLGRGVACWRGRGACWRGRGACSGGIIVVWTDSDGLQLSEQLMN